MAPEAKKRSTPRRQSTATIASGLVNTGVESPVVKGNSRPTDPGNAVGGNFLAAPAPQSGPPAPEDILIDVDAYGDGMAFRFTWR